MMIINNYIILTGLQVNVARLEILAVYDLKDETVPQRQEGEERVSEQI